MSDLNVPQPLAYVLFAEDVRTEATGQLTLVGVFSANLALSTIPGVLPKFSLMARAFFNKSKKPKELKFILEYPWNESPEIIQAPLEQLQEWESSDFVGVALSGVFAPFNILSTGVIRAFIEVDGIKHWAGALRIIQTAEGT